MDDRPDHLGRRRTYSPAQWEDAQDQWARGHFSDEWDDWRLRAARGPGIIFPPAGTEWDSWADDEPSQRAILIRAIRETPELLRIAIDSASRPSWDAVIGHLFEGRTEMREMLDIDDAGIKREKAEETTPRQATYALGEILRILGDSAR